jgi:hypothetical protein
MAVIATYTTPEEHEDSEEEIKAREVQVCV